MPLPLHCALMYHKPLITSEQKKNKMKLAMLQRVERFRFGVDLYFYGCIFGRNDAMHRNESIVVHINRIRCASFSKWFVLVFVDVFLFRFSLQKKRNAVQ